MSLTLRYHGGQCCGISHIHGFKRSATENEPANKADNGLPGATGDTYRLPTGERPAETRLERLDYLISVDKHLRTGGIIEVVLADYQWPDWHDALIERGFKNVMEARNSNSARYIRVYLLDTNSPPKTVVAKEKPLR